MLDTIKLGVPLTQKQYDKIHAFSFQSAREQWVLLIPTTGELRFRRISGLTETDQNSYHREIRWDIPASYLPPRAELGDGKFLKADKTFLTLELSLPKLSYGHNIHLLHEFTTAIAKLKKLLEKQFNFQGKAKLADIGQWQIWRLDCCYAWRMPSQQIAQQVLDSLKHLHYPRKKPIIYPTTIFFGGNTYSVKFYLKLPEFKNHDSKALIKAKASKGWVSHLENKANGVLRYEATLRRKYLERQNIKTVADLARPLIELELDQELTSNGEDPFLIIQRVLDCNHDELETESDQEWLEKLWDGRRFTAGGGCTILVTPEGTQEYEHQAAGITIRRTDNPTVILKYFLEKFIGEHGMQKADEVEAKLMATYKPVKAARLISFWLYVQRFGTAKAKEVFGLNSYYVSRRALKEAGVSLIEATNTVVTVDADFLRNLKLEVPSHHVTNEYDDFDDHDNLLNFVPRPTELES
jgi:hypothetical protein